MKRIISHDFLWVLMLSLIIMPAVSSAQVILDRQGNTPVSMKFEKGNQPTVASFFQEYRKAYPLSEENQMEALSVSSDRTGSHHRFDQYYKGVKVLGAQYILHESDGSVWYANGRLVHNLDLDVIPVLSKDQALQLAIQAVDAEVYRWEIPENEAFIKRLKDDPQATFYPTGDLLLTSGFNDLTAENIRLAYRFDVYAQQPLGRYWVSVDARTGDIICRETRLFDLDVPGSGLSLYNGIVPLTVQEIVPGSVYTLMELTTRGAPVVTMNLNNEWDYSNVTDFISPTPDGLWDPAGVNAHYGAEATWDYYWNEYGINSLDNAGWPLVSLVHLGEGYVDAFYDGYNVNYGDGNGVNFFPLVSLDIAGHEFTHGVTMFNANYVYYGEPGALHETFSDIFGNMIEFYKEGVPGVGTGSWYIGEDFSASGLGFRNMADPNEMYQPDTYLGNYWLPSNGGDNAGVHVNDGVPNYWFYLMAMGGSGVNDNGDVYNVTGIGLDDASDIAYLTNTAYLSMYSTFFDARVASIAAAEALFGAGSQQVMSNMAAWDAVGVYDFETPSNDLCMDAIELFCNDVVSGTTIGATFDPEAPWCDYEHTGKGVWYKFTGNGYNMLLSMCGGPLVWDARITVYEGGCDDLTCVAFNDDGCGYGSLSKVAWTTVSGTEYHILVHGFYGMVGPFTLSLTSLEHAGIAVSPESLEIIVPLDGSGSEGLTISSIGDECTMNLDWYAYGTEPLLPVINSGKNQPGGNNTYSTDLVSNDSEKSYVPFTAPMKTAVGLAGAGSLLNNPFPISPPSVVSTRNLITDDQGIVVIGGERGTTSETVVTITHSLDQSILNMNSVACFDGTVSTDNSYWRAFYLPDFGIVNTFNVISVEIGLEYVAPYMGNQTLTVNLYTSEGDVFPMGVLNLVGSATYDLEEQYNTMLTMPVTGTIPAGSELVVEIFSPGGNYFWIGSNDLGQTGPSYLSAPYCALYTPIDIADLGFPGMHIVMNVTGSFEESCPWLSLLPNYGSITASSSQMVSVMADAAGMDPGTYECEVKISSNAFENSYMTVPVTLIVDNMPPEITVAGPITLWPPDHKYENFDLSELIVSITDDVDGEIPVSEALIESSSSDEPDDAPGNGDGKTINDMVIAMDCKSVDLRRERQGSGNGRVYLVHLSASDQAGNMAYATCTVNVPLDWSTTVVDDGPVYEVFCGETYNTDMLLGIEKPQPGNFELVVQPNPFTGQATVHFKSAKAGNVSLTVYSAMGAEVLTLFDGMVNAGDQYTIVFNAEHMPPGIYFCRLQGGIDQIALLKIMLIK